MSEGKSIASSTARIVQTTRAPSADALTDAGVAVVATLDGAAARDKAHFMAAVAKALSFPDYFGANWDAFEECLDDLHWQNQSIVLIIDHADKLLADAANDREILFKIVGESFAPNPELPHSSFKLVLVAAKDAPIVALAAQSTPVDHLA